ncbi:hypothetical protein ACLKA6_008352 [Drosophila palustris]
MQGHNSVYVSAIFQPSACCLSTSVMWSKCLRPLGHMFRPNARATAITAAKLLNQKPKATDTSPAGLRPDQNRCIM